MVNKHHLKILYAASATLLEKTFSEWANSKNIKIISTSYIIYNGYHLSVVYVEN